jgi:uncharacterized membrane protein (UPF0127 family)
MYRERVPKNGGMLFSFTSPFRLSFWMKDTRVPLDIAFIDDDLVIREIREMVPMSMRSTAASFPCRYALEANAGWFEQHGIVSGSKLTAAWAPDDAESQIPAPVEPPVPDMREQPSQPQQQEKREPPPDLVVNISFKDAVKFANIHKLAIAFEYEYPENNVNSYILEPMGEYIIKPGATAGDLVCGPCRHSDGEYRNFIIDNIIDFDLVETQGEGRGRIVAVPAPEPLGPAEPEVAASSEGPRTALGRSFSELIREAQGYSPGGQLMMTEYWDEIKDKRQHGKTEGQAILEYLEENAKRNAPQREKDKKKKKKSRKKKSK